MALDQPALLEVLEVLKAAEVDDRIRQAAETIYQALIEAELTAVIGAYPHQRTEARTQRNGHRPRTISTTAGDLDLRIPRLWVRSFFPSRLERRQRVDQSLFAVSCSVFPGNRRHSLGPLHGVPFTVKENLDVEGRATRTVFTRSPRGLRPSLDPCSVGWKPLTRFRPTRALGTGCTYAHSHYIP